jgi:putative membrane protein
MRLRAVVTAAALGLAAQVAGAQAPAPQAGQDQAQLKATFEHLHQGNARIAEFARLASEKGTSPQVKALGERVLREHEAMQRELAQFAQQRGIALSDARASVNHPAIQGELTRLRALQGQQFDAEIAKWFEANRTQEVQAYKDARDRVAGKDAALKQWIDQAENKLEAQRNLARDVRADVQSAERQGRRAPAAK